MSMKTLPLLFINLGGEMMYILDQRLRAQGIAEDKSKKVLHDIVATMFNQRFVDEVFKPQALYSKKAMRTMFDRLAHASIMRLNAASMDKLYDLMTMAFKYQVSLALRPKDILLITLNHMDTMRSYIEGSTTAKTLIEYVYEKVTETYASLSHGEFQLIRQTLLNFFQDMHIRVSIFLKDKVQNNNGHFILTPEGTLPFGVEIPGTIRSFDDNGKSRNIGFKSGASYTTSTREGSFGLVGDRIIKLGNNMYSVSRPVETSGGNSVSYVKGSDLDINSQDPLAKAHLDLLAHLIGTNATKDEFRLNLFKNDQEEEEVTASIQLPESASSHVVNIDASKKSRSSELTQIMNDMMLDDKGGTVGDDNDLLDLMDS